MQSIEYIKGSNGSGDASLATVQSTRSPGATTLDVDTVLGVNGAGFMGSMGTPHTFTDPVTGETITVISEATAVDFSGHVDGSNLEIDEIAPGYTDAGSAVGDIVIIRPTTQWSDNIAEVLETAHDDDGSLKDGAVDAAGVLAANVVTTAKILNANVTPDKLSSSSDCADVATSQTTTSTSYADLATTTDSVTVTVGANGKVLINLFAYLALSVASGETAFVGFAASGANTIAATDVKAIRYQPWTTGAFGQYGATFLLKGLTPGVTTFKMKYRVSSGTGTFANRHIGVTPQ